MAKVISYKNKLIEEINKMSERERGKFYKVLKLLKSEFINIQESRYYTKEWIDAEKEASEAYKKGNLKVFNSVKELSNYIETNIKETIKE